MQNRNKIGPGDWRPEAESGTGFDLPAKGRFAGRTGPDVTGSF